MPDLVIREDRLAEGLDYLATEIGRDPPVLPDDESEAFSLADIYDDTVETAVRNAYQRDYMMFGFRPWA